MSGGLIYVGNHLPAEAGGGPDPALIDPGLAVDPRAPDYAGEGMGYWPSYSRIEPRCRAAYLHWLADGRHARGACIGYVFLYFYGLERRLLVDARQSKAAWSERPALLAEVRRLLDIYGSNGSFRRYAQSLLDLFALENAERRYLSAPPVRREGWDLPFEVRLALGQLAADRRPVPANWALAWLHLHPYLGLRTPATRCPREFDEVFARLYQKGYGDGLLAPRGRAKLDSSYQPASNGISRRPLPGAARIPDIADMDGPLAALRALADEACTELDAYSRYLGRHPEGAGTAAALALLPGGIERPADAATQALVAWAQDSLGPADQVQVPAAELLTRWSAAAPESRPGKADAALLARVLDRHHLGLEPDVRFGGPAPAGDGTLIIFRRAAQVVSAPTAEYTAAATITQLGAAVAAADGRVAAAERELLEHRVVAALDLGEDEQRRLRAHLSRALASPPSPAVLRKRASVLPEGQRRQAGDLLAALAASDGTISAAETRLLARLFDVLGLDTGGISQLTHPADAEALTQLQTAGPAPAAYPIPQPSPPERAPGVPAVMLDPELLRARVAESAQVAAYLAGIFTEDAEPGTSECRPAGTASAGRAGLDTPHAALLGRLAERSSWPRSELDSAAAELGLRPEGALEVLNDAAFDAVGEPVCEGTDPVEINRFALEEMLS